MKRYLKIQTTILLVLLSIGTIMAQTDQVIVPLTNPDKPGLLKVTLGSGTVTVKGYSGKEVVVRFSADQSQVDKKTKDGLTRIPNNSLGLTARESDNQVTISSSNYNRDITIEIQVPTRFDLKLNGQNGGDYVVENVTGNIEITNHNAGITARNISGAAILNSYNGDVNASFQSVTPDTPMAFTTWNGDVEVTFPSSIKATFKMRSDNDEILTDFELTLKKSAPKQEGKREDGVYKITLEDWTIGDVNGGGPEMLFKTYNGDVIIRKKK